MFKRFSITDNVTNIWRTAKVGVTDLQVVGYCSYNENYECKEADLSRLQYYNPPPRSIWPSICYDLDCNYEEAKTEPVDFTSTGIDDLLRWIVKHSDELKAKAGEGKRLDADFIALRGTLRKLISVSYEVDHGWIICAVKFQGNIYLCTFHTRESERWVEQKYSDKRLLWGFKFKQYILSENPNTLPDPLKPVNTAEKFCCYFKSKFGNHKLLYSAEIDAVVSNKPLEEPIDWEKVRFVDVRMTLFNPNSRNPENFLDKNSFKWWTQSHFVNVNNVLCGFRTDDAFIIALNEYNLEELVKAKSRSRKQFYWDPEVCTDFFNRFLDYVKQNVTRDHDECIYKFEWYPRWRHIEMEEVDACSSKFSVLKDWFVREMKNSQ